jgi:GntR family transcriptional regulator / MocR family aminotransferase
MQRSIFKILIIPIEPMELAITLDSTSGEPLQRQLYSELRRGIITGRLARGLRLPPTRELAGNLGISRTTVTLVYESLVSEGYLEGRTGAGTYVASCLPDELLEPTIELPTAAASASAEAAPPSTLSSFGRYLASTELLGPRKDPEFQFAFGRPDGEHFPMGQWLRLLNKHGKSAELSYLELPKRSQGHPLYLGRSRGVNVQPEQIIIVNGSQQAADLVTRLFVEQGEYVGMEDPCWVGAKTIFESQGARLWPVPVDEEGIRVSELCRPETPSMKLLYVTPSHQFPTGAVLSLSRRFELLAWAKRANTYIVEDDYDSEFRYSGRPVPALAGLDTSQRVLYIGTFSKVLFVSLRLGYLVVPPNLVHAFAHGKWLTDRHSPILEQLVLADFINEGHLERHIRRMRKIYEERREALIQSLDANFGNRVRIVGQNAGIHVLVEFATNLSTDEVMEQAYAAGVGLLPAMHLQQLKVGFGRKAVSFIMCYGALTPEQIAEGVRRLARAIKQ